MTDWNEQDLASLAPEVDEAAARTLFRSRRAKLRRRRRAELVLLFAAFSAVVVVTVVAVDNRHAEVVVGTGATVPPSTTTPSTIPTPAFELLDVRGAHDQMGTLRASVDATSLTSIWSESGFGDQPPTVDFRRWVVVFVTIPDNACPPAVGGIQREGTVLTPEFTDITAGCVDPLIPKTYVIELNRSTVEPSFTLRLPADETYGFGEQRLEVDVPKTEAAPPLTEPTTPPQHGPLVMVPLPPTDETRSALLADGTPLWVVHHPDGTVSAIPAIGPGSLVGDSVGGLWTTVVWSDGRFFRGATAWDAWGRTLNDGRDADLSTYRATVYGDQVVISLSGLDRVPGTPVLTSGGGPLMQPELPPLRDSLTDLPAGWSQIDASLVGDNGVFRICPVDPTVPVAQLAACPLHAPLVSGLTDSESRSWNFGPLLVEVDDSGNIEHVAPLGGYAGG